MKGMSKKRLRQRRRKALLKAARAGSGLSVLDKGPFAAAADAAAGTAAAAPVVAGDGSAMGDAVRRAYASGPGKLAKLHIPDGQEDDVRRTPCSRCGRPLGKASGGEPSLSAMDGVLVSALCGDCNFTAFRDRVAEL